MRESWLKRNVFVFSLHFEKAKQGLHTVSADLGLQELAHCVDFATGLCYTHMILLGLVLLIRLMRFTGRM